ncbi:hypothetical protein L596_022712 [Steinernema carpocapsae]|uniref:Decapping nuclease n=1 Tax=Steinernema carpocapsae TaxID=34508 RepID=A0A4V6A0A9_STECR|nr:hypothetical protein L596_022712 [Steinernema carpocapsae]
MPQHEPIYLHKIKKEKLCKHIDFRVTSKSSLTVDPTGNITMGIDNARRLVENLVDQSLATPVDAQRKFSITKQNANLFQILVALSQNANDADLLTVAHESDIIASRGALADVAAHKHNFSNKLKLVVGFYQDCLFLTKRSDSKSSDAGLKAELAITSPKEGEPSFYDCPSVPWHQLYAQTLVQIGYHSLFVNGEYDCLDKNDKRVEIKLKKGGLSSYNLFNLSSSQVYMQARLLDTEDVVVATHEGNEQITRFDRINISKLETGNPSFDSSSIKFEEGTTELKFTWTEDELLTNLEHFLRKLYTMCRSYPDKILVIENGLPDSNSESDANKHNDSTENGLPDNNSESDANKHSDSTENGLPDSNSNSDAKKHSDSNGERKQKNVFYVTKVANDRSLLFPKFFTEHFDRIGQ